MTSLHQAWVALRPRLKILELLPLSSEQWSLIERLQANFNDREAHTRLPMSIARFRDDASKAIHEHATQFGAVIGTPRQWQGCSHVCDDARRSHWAVYVRAAGSLTPPASPTTLAGA